MVFDVCRNRDDGDTQLSLLRRCVDVSQTTAVNGDDDGDVIVNVCHSKQTNKNALFLFVYIISLVNHTTESAVSSMA